MRRRSSLGKLSVAARSFGTGTIGGAGGSNLSSVSEDQMESEEDEPVYELTQLEAVPLPGYYYFLFAHFFCPLNMFHVFLYPINRRED